MWNRISLLVLLILIVMPAAAYADSGESTRVVDAKQHAYGGDSRYPYRQKSDYVMKELDLKSGDIVVDIGAGDGFWARQMAKSVGAEGVIHASEVEQRKVNDMKESSPTCRKSSLICLRLTAPLCLRTPVTWLSCPRPTTT